MYNLTEKVILEITSAIMAGVSFFELHQALIDKGWSEEEIFLFIQASRLLIRYRRLGF